MNKWIVQGRLGKDPEVRYTPSGTAVTNFSVATSRKWKDKNGAPQEETEWTNVVFWGKRAEVIGEYFSKGKMILVEGRAQTSSWEGKDDGIKRYKTELVGENFWFCGDKGGGGYTPKESDYGGAPGTAPAPGTGPGPVDDDIPF